MFVALLTRGEMRHYEGGKGMFTAGIGVSKQQPSWLIIVHLNVMHAYKILFCQWLNVCACTVLF